MAGPLKGTRVLELANFISGPYAAMLLADLGADVIKVELPGTGDPFREWSGQPGDHRPQFAAYNRGKRSITVNLRAPTGVDIVKRIASDIDVIIENFRPGTLDRLGLGYETIRAFDPRVIYCSVSGFGATGPYHHKPTYDAIAQAVSGLWSVISDLDDPHPVGPALSDQLSGLYAAQGILAALVSRGTSGEGQRVDVSMMAASMAFLTNPIADYLMQGRVHGPDTRSHRSQSYAFMASDGLPLAVHLSSVPKFWEAIVRATGSEELLDDPRFRTKDDRVANYDAVHDALQEAFGAKTRREWLEVLEDHDVPVAAINSVAEAVEDPQAEHLGMVQTFGDGNRAVRLVGFPMAFGATPLVPDRPPPDPGEHNHEVLKALGYADVEIESFGAEQVI